MTSPRKTWNCYYCHDYQKPSHRFPECPDFKARLLQCQHHKRTQIVNAMINKATNPIYQPPKPNELADMEARAIALLQNLSLSHNPIPNFDPSINNNASSMNNNPNNNLSESVRVFPEVPRIINNRIPTRDIYLPPLPVDKCAICEQEGHCYPQCASLGEETHIYQIQRTLRLSAEAHRVDTKYGALPFSYAYQLLRIKQLLDDHVATYPLEDHLPCPLHLLDHTLHFVECRKPKDSKVDVYNPKWEPSAEFEIIYKNMCSDVKPAVADDIKPMDMSYTNYDDFVDLETRNPFTLNIVLDD